MSTMDHTDALAGLMERERSRFFGKFRGKVTNVNDPEKMGRIKATVPEIFEEQESPWALPAVPFAGPKHGLVLIPEVDDGVWIEFEAGDPSRPIWTGCWWGSGDMPSPADVKVRSLITSPGHQFFIDDDAGEITLKHAGGAELKMTDSEITLTIGQSEFKMTSSEIGLKVTTVEIKLSATELTLKGSPVAQVKLSASGTEINNGAIKVT